MKKRKIRFNESTSPQPKLLNVDCTMLPEEAPKQQVVRVTMLPEKKRKQKPDTKKELKELQKSCFANFANFQQSSATNWRRSSNFKTALLAYNRTCRTKSTDCCNNEKTRNQGE